MAFNTNAKELLFEITQAIQRIEKRSYGLCEITGKPIEASRLEAIPWARFSLQGQIAMESNTPRRPAIPILQSIVDFDIPDTEENDDLDESEASRI